MKSPEPFIGIKEAAELLFVAPKTLYSWKKSKRLKCYKVGKRNLFRKSEIIEFVEKHEVKTQEELEKFAREYKRRREEYLNRKVC